MPYLHKNTVRSFKVFLLHRDEMRVFYADFFQCGLKKLTQEARIYILCDEGAITIRIIFILHFRHHDSSSR